MSWSAQNGADLLYHHANFGGAGTSHATRGAKNLMFFFVHHAFERQLAVVHWCQSTKLLSVGPSWN